MKFVKFFAPVAALAIVPGIAVASPETKSMEYEGARYSYTDTQSDTVRIIAGTNEATGEDFKLRVKGRRVTGYFGSKAVAFTMKKTTLAKVQSSGAAVASGAY